MTRAALLRDVVGLGIAAVAAAAVLAADPPPLVPPAPALASVAAMAAWIAWQDLSDFTIPDGAVAGLALVGVTWRIVGGAAAGVAPGEAALLVLFDAVLAGGGLWLVREVYFRRRGFDGLGLGDVKLGAAGAVLLGGFGFALALAAASLVGIAVALLLHRGATTPIGARRLAFGAVLAPAIALVFLAGAAGLLPGPVV